MNTNTAFVGLMESPLFVALWQGVFTLAAGGLVAMGLLTRHLSGFDAFGAAVVPAFAVLVAVQVHRRLRRVRAERPFDASETMLVNMLLGLQSVALLALGLATS